MKAYLSGYNGTLAGSRTLAAPSTHIFKVNAHFPGEYRLVNCRGLTVRGCNLSSIRLYCTSLDYSILYYQARTLKDFDLATTVQVFGLNTLDR